MIDLRPYSATEAHMVFRSLDGWDMVEAEASRGGPASYHELFADWHAMQPRLFFSAVVHARVDGTSVPFAVTGAGHTGMAGVAMAAFLSRDHHAWRIAIARYALWMRGAMPDLAAANGVRRVEARSLSTHPTAAAFMTRIGLAREARMPGFGPEGRDSFDLYAWTSQGGDNV